MSYAALLARMLVDPMAAVGEIRKSQPVVQALIASVLASVVYYLVLDGFFRDVRAIVALGGYDEGAIQILTSHLRHLPRLLMPTVFVSAFYVPVALLVLGGAHRYLRAFDTLRTEYRSTLAVALSSWALSMLVWLVPAMVFADVTSAPNRLMWSLLPALIFLLPVTIGLAMIADSGYVLGGASAVFASVSLALMPIAIWSSFLLTSPVFLIVMFFILRGMMKEWMSSRDARERLRQNLESATLNPADSSAHVNLGLIYQERGDADLAVEHYTKALEIDPAEIDALYQLGRIARQRRQFAEAITRFDGVVQMNNEHAHSEVWREIGATYHDAGQFEDALGALEHYLGSRPSDAEGLYLLGVTLNSLGRVAEARDQMRAVVDTVRTAPNYKYRLDRRWLIAAEQFLKQ